MISVSPFLGLSARPVDTSVSGLGHIPVSDQWFSQFKFCT